MASADWSLQKSIYQALSNAPQLVALLGGARIYDDAPQRADFPYLTLGQSAMRDWSTGTETGKEHIVTLHVWSRNGGKKEAHEIIDAIEGVLHDQPLPVEDHHLVNLRLEFSEARPDPDGHTYHGIVRYRAVTETEAA